MSLVFKAKPNRGLKLSCKAEKNIGTLRFEPNQIFLRNPAMGNLNLSFNDGMLLRYEVI